MLCLFGIFTLFLVLLMMLIVIHHMRWHIRNELGRGVCRKRILVDKRPFEVRRHMMGVCGSMMDIMSSFMYRRTGMRHEWRLMDWWSKPMVLRESMVWRRYKMVARR